MINIRVHEVDNIPIFKNKSRKTIISCYSYSSYRYFYGTYKSKDKSTNPKWNLDFNADLFKIIHLRFFLYGIGSNDNNFFIGSVTFNFIDFVSNSPGNQILNNQDTSVQYQFPIKSSKTADSKLTLSFTYIPVLYPQIKFKPSFFANPIFHTITTFEPSLNQNEHPVEVELLQAFTVLNEQNIKNIGLYYNLNKETSWESVGKSSLDRYFIGPTGLSQIHSLPMGKLNGKYTFFILNVSNFTGKVTLNILYEKIGETVHFADKCFIKTKKKNQKISLIKTIDVDVQPHKKYLIPFYIYIDTNSSKYQINNFISDTEKIIFDKSKIKDYSTLDYSSKLSSEIEFHSQIIERAHTISEIEKVDFLRTNILTNNEPISLPRTLCDYNLNPDSALRFYVGGATTNIVGENVYMDYWQQNFIVYDKATGHVCHSISKMIDDQLIQQKPEKRMKSYLPLRTNRNSILTLNLNKIGRDKILVYYVYCYSYLHSAFPNGFFMITQYENRSEKLLFQNPIFADSWNAHYATCFRFEFIQDEWKIIPMRNYFETEKEMKISLNSMKSNNWILPPVLITKTNEQCKTQNKSSNDCSTKDLTNNT